MKIKRAENFIYFLRNAFLKKSNRGYKIIDLKLGILVIIF